VNQPAYILIRGPTAANRQPASVKLDSLPERSVVAATAALRRDFGALWAFGPESMLAVNGRTNVRRKYID